ncbi:MAG TPA: alginate lyase family protein, partial [Acidimicrobiia bacterium]|nr:alginate lyase family protein [Acidimicrobiia bacterium]
RLGYVLDAACRRPEFSDREVTELLNCTMRHVEALRDDDRFAAHSNHGFYFAAGQLALARRFAPTLPELQSDVAQARDRLLQLVDDQFASDGIHREHSTDYARMVLSTFENLIDSGLIEGSDFIDRRNLVQDALAWFVMPDGYLTMFGDSPHRAFTLKPSRGDVWYVEPEQIGSQALVFQATGGVRGRPPETSVRAFPDGGFAVVREGWPTGSEDFGDWGYLAQICAFHSRVHKHADDLSFVWYDRGHEILIDPGRFGYGERAKGELKDQGFYYADPRRVYVESTAAHNTVEIDGRSYNRKVERPYGSALRRCGEVGGIAYTEAVVVHAEDVIHERVLLYRPARWLLVLDWVSDPRNKCHDVAQHFHFAPELAVREHKDTVQVELPDRDLLHVVSLDGATGLPVVSGQKRPMRGWISRKDGEIEPCSSTGFRRRGSAVALATLLAFSDLPRPASCRFADDRRAATVEWDAAGLRHRVEIKRNDPFEIAHHVAVERGGGSNRP